MIKYRNIALTIISLSIKNLLVSQTVIINNQQHENSTETQVKLNNADTFSTEAQKALDAKDYDKALYYLDQWSHMGKVDNRFYIQMADVLLAQGKYDAAKKHLMKAYKKYGCYECKEKAEKLRQ